MSSASIALQPCGLRSKQLRSPRGRAIKARRTAAVRMSASEKEHVVQDGEWLIGIGQKYSVDFEELKSLNPGIDYDVIVPGQHIVLPE